MINIAHVYVRDRDYSVFISLCVTSKNFHVFKYNDVSCDYEVFKTEREVNQFLEQSL